MTNSWRMLQHVFTLFNIITNIHHIHILLVIFESAPVERMTIINCNRGSLARAANYERRGAQVFERIGEGKDPVRRLEIGNTHTYKIGDRQQQILRAATTEAEPLKRVQHAVHT